jgi:hypothetical protein
MLLSWCPTIFTLSLRLVPTSVLNAELNSLRAGSHSVQEEFGFRAPVWQRGFSEVRIYDSEHFMRVMDYIAQNPVRRRLAQSADAYPYSSFHPGFELDEVPQGLKPGNVLLPTGTSEDVP